MRVTIMAIGSRGDVQPLVALGRGLRSSGHEVRVVAGDEFEGLLRSAALEFVPLGIQIQQAMAVHRNIFRFMKSITGQILSACPDDQDAIVSTFLGVSTCCLARERHIPFFYALQIPALRTAAFPDPLFPPLPLGKTYNRLTHQINELLVKRSYADAQCLFDEPRPHYLFHFSPSLIPRPADWGAFAHVTGFWFLEQPADWQPPAELVSFLQEGPPPVSVGFGSTATGNPQQLTELVTTALRQAKQRGVLVTGWGGLEGSQRSDDLFVTASVPFDWLFPRVTAAVHHGGAGTLVAALRAGIPSVAVPFGLDQPFWARQVARLGVGTAPIMPRQLTAERLASAITSAVSAPQMRARAGALGEQICREDGIGNAVEIIEGVITGKSGTEHG